MVRIVQFSLACRGTYCFLLTIFHRSFSCSPNSCAQVQVADIGIMGGPAKKEIDGKKMAVPGCKIFVGGKIGEDAHLAMEPVMTGIPLDEADLIPALVEILKTEFGAVDKKKPLLKRIKAKLPFVN
jgi:dissimilatory sulfite reductase (desulfoviridin) alpha/beta subunit